MNAAEFNWTNEPVIGLVLMNAERDSNGIPIDPNTYYKVGKHKQSDMLIIEATNRNMKNEFINNIWKRKGKMN